MAENETGSLWDALVMQPELSPREKALRDQFVKEYLFDRDAWAAAIRVGFLKVVAAQYAQMLLEEPYVRREIARLEAKIAANPKEAVKAEQRSIKASLFREAHYRGPGSTHAARVQALSKLATINDMDAPTKIKQTVTHKGGVMMVPAIASIDDWEKAARESQDKLIQEARH